MVSVPEMSSFVHQCSTAASSFSDDLGISPQDLMLNNAGNSSKEIYRDAEARQDGSGFLPMKPQEQDWAANISMSHDQSSSDTQLLVPPESTRRPSHINHQTSQRCTSRVARTDFVDTQAELRKKRDELAAAEAIVSTLRNEVKTLEASTKAFEEIRLENTPHTNKHKWSEEETTHRAKRVKENMTVRGGSDLGNEKIVYPIKKHHSISKESWSPKTREDASQMMDFMSPGSTMGNDTDTEHSFPKFFDTSSPSNTLYSGSGNTFKFESLQSNLLNEESKRQAVLVGS